jgi:DNA-binding beta-propeller fold protein YncE
MTPPAGAAQGPAMTNTTTLPPEVEVTVNLQLPQASEHYVYAANPEAGTVAVIDAETQAIHTIETAGKPTYLRTLAGADAAIVLNQGRTGQITIAPTATVIRTPRDGDSTSKDIQVVSGANAIEVAPDSKHAVVYYNATYASANNGSGSFQDVSVLVLSGDGSSDKAINMTVGFRPRALFFSSDGARAFVVTEDGVSVLDFAQIEKDGEGIARLVTFGNIDLKAVDVAITPDGRYALARAEGQPVLHLVELDGNAPRKELDLSMAYQGTPPPPPASEDDAGVPPPLPFDVTDLDILPNGKAAVAVLRNQRALLRIPLPEAFDDPTAVHTISVGTEVVGSVTASNDGKTALLYTTAIDFERLTIVDLTTDTALRTVALRKAVQAVAFTPDDKSALITHKRADGDPNQPGISPDLKLDRSDGYSLLRIASGDVKLQQTASPLGPIAMVPDSTFLFILFRDDPRALREVHRVSLSSFLVDPITPLENPPISIGVAPASHSVFINLLHPDGRMTFIDWNDPGAIKTVTGFELNSRIRN